MLVQRPSATIHLFSLLLSPDFSLDNLIPSKHFGFRVLHKWTAQTKGVSSNDGVIVRREFELIDETASRQFASAVAKHIVQGDVLALSGPLGAGKTFFTRELCSALGVGEIVSSPSYVLMHEYGDDVVHIDLYRLESEEEVWELGLQEIFGRKTVLIEWPDLARGILPTNTIHIEFAYRNQHRSVTLEGNQPWIESVRLA